MEKEVQSSMCMTVYTRKHGEGIMMGHGRKRAYVMWVRFGWSWLR